MRSAFHCSPTGTLYHRQAPFQREFEIDVRGRTVQTPVVDGSDVQLVVEAGEIKSNSDGEKAVHQLAKLFAVLERVVIAAAAGESALWKDGITVSGTGEVQGSNGVTYVFVGRVISDAPVAMQEAWSLPESAGVRFLQPTCMRFVSTSMD